MDGRRARRARRAGACISRAHGPVPSPKGSVAMRRANRQHAYNYSDWRPRMVRASLLGWVSGRARSSGGSRGGPAPRVGPGEGPLLGWVPGRAASLLGWVPGRAASVWMICPIGGRAADFETHCCRRIVGAVQPPLWMYGNCDTVCVERRDVIRLLTVRRQGLLCMRCLRGQ
jgi:hypothetical protein